VSAGDATRGTIEVNGESRPLEDRLLLDLMRRLGIDPERRGLAVAINGEVVPRSEWPSRGLDDGDRVEILGAVQGG
jgi:sulfur carrier protein